MRQEQMMSLDDCTEFRQTLQARPPKIVHGTALLLATLLAGALVWSAVTKANLVVRAPGRVRPISAATEVTASFGPKIDGRVAEVHYEEGAPIRKGQVLIRSQGGDMSAGRSGTLHCSRRRRWSAYRLSLQIRNQRSLPMNALQELRTDQMAAIEGGIMSDGSFRTALYILFNAGKILA